MDEEVPPAGTSGGGGAGAAPPARGTRVRPGDAGGGPRSPPLQGCLSPQEELQGLLLRMVKAVLSPGQREIPRATGNRGRTPATAGTRRVTTPNLRFHTEPRMQLSGRAFKTINPMCSTGFTNSNLISMCY